MEQEKIGPLVERLLAGLEVDAYISKEVKSKGKQNQGRGKNFSRRT